MQVGAHTLTTQYDYDAVGQLTGLTLPSGMHYTYGYDTAGRLESIQNSKGEAIAYTLDAAGNRTTEVITHSGGGTAYTTSRQFDELSRVIKAFDHTLVAHQYQYDDNGNVDREIDRKGYQMDRLFDGLDRLRQMNFADNGSAVYAYNALDQLTSVTDQANHTTTYVYDGLGNLISMASPDTGTTNYEYDTAGNRNKKVDANGVVTLYGYDALSRLTQVSYPANAALNASYTYDGTVYSYGIGRLSTISDNTGGMALFHDPVGRVAAKYIAIQGVTYLINYGYDTAGNPAWIKMPDGRHIDYSYDSVGDVTAVTTRKTAASAPVLLANSFSVLPFGPIKGWIFGNSVVHTVSYDEGYRVEAVMDQASPDILDLTYGYDANHNIDTLDNGVNSALSQSFSYDERNRLDTASGVYGAHDYDYDLVGNRTQFNRAGYSETFNISPTSHRLDSISIDDNGVSSQRTLSYDNAGNTMADSRGYSYGYAQNNRLILTGGPHGGAWLFTNAQGQRVITQPTSAGITPRHYLYDAAGELVMESNGVTGQVLKHYIRVDGQLLAITAKGTDANGQPTAAKIYYVHSDHLGTPQKLTDANAQVVWEAEYEPFGQATVNEDPDGDGTSIEFNLRFPGQYYDKYSGVNYNYFRDYDPSTGRYIQSDPQRRVATRVGLSIPSYRYVNGLNHQYGYTNQNPLIYADLTGEASVTISLYAGYGGSLSIGVDPRSGKPFFGVVAGWGAGGGISFDPLGGTPDECGEDYFGLVGTFGVTAANASAGLDGNAGFSGEGPDFQAGATPYLSTEGKAGLKAEASAGLGAFFSF